MAQLQASRHGVNLIVVRNGSEVLSKATGELRPDAIVLSSDLKEPATDEIVRTLNADPRLKGVQVIVLNGLLGSVGQLLKSFKGTPWNFRLPKS